MHFKWPCMLFVTEALASLRFRYRGRQFLKTWRLWWRACQQGTAVCLMCRWAEWQHKWLNILDVHRSLWFPPSCLFSSPQSVTHIPSTSLLVIIRASLNWSVSCSMDEYFTTLFLYFSWHIKYTVLRSTAYRRETESVHLCSKESLLVSDVPGWSSSLG